MSWQFQWLTSWDEVLSPTFQSRWQHWSAEAANRHVFFHPALAGAWLKTYRALRDLQPRFLLGQSGRTTAFFPLVLWKQNWKNGWRRLLVPAGYSDFDYHDPLLLGDTIGFDWGAFWDGFFEDVKTSFGPEFDLLEIPGIRKEFTGGHSSFKYEDESPFIDLKPFQDRKDFLASLKSKVRTDLIRREHRLGSVGQVTFRRYATHEGEEAVASLQQMLQHHARRWPGAYKAPGFHDLLLRECLPLDLVHFSELQVAGQPISWRLGFVFGGRFYSYMPAFVEEYANFSPGKIHLAKCINRAIERRLTTYDQLRGTEGYKAEWATGAQKLFRVRLMGERGGSGLRNWATVQGHRLLSRGTAGNGAQGSDLGKLRRKSGTLDGPSSCSWEFQWLTSWSEVLSQSVQAQWQRWAEQADNTHAFFHPALVAAWIETYRPIRALEPRFLVARKNSATVFYPLVLWRQDWKTACRRLIIPVGYSDFDYNEPLAIGAEAEFGSFWEAFIPKLQRRWAGDYDFIHLGEIRESAAAGGIPWQPSGTCAWCDLTPFSDADAFLSSLKKSLRGDIGRQKRRLAELGSLEFHVYRASELAQAEEALIPFLSFHAKRWPNAYKAPRFHANLLRHGLPAGLLHFSELRLNGRAISWHLGFVWSGRFYYYLPAIDPGFVNFSPGKVHLFFCVEAAIKSGLTTFDHLRGDESYKGGWADEILQLKRACLVNNSIRSKAVSVAVTMKARLQDRGEDPQAAFR